VSRRRTKQRRSSAWRRHWCAFLRWVWAKHDPGLDALAALMADYNEALQRAEPAAGLGRRVPQP